MNDEKKCGCNIEQEDCGCHEHEHDCGCGCDCGCEEELEAITVELEDEQGNIITCEMVDGFEFKNKEYAVVVNPADETYYLFEVVGEGEEGELVVPNEEEFESVRDYYETLISEEEEEEENEEK